MVASQSVCIEIGKSLESPGYCYVKILHLEVLDSVLGEGTLKQQGTTQMLMPTYSEEAGAVGLQTVSWL